MKSTAELPVARASNGIFSSMNRDEPANRLFGNAVSKANRKTGISGSAAIKRAQCRIA